MDDFLAATVWEGSWFLDFLCDAVVGLIESNDIANQKMTQHEFRQPSVCECQTGAK